MRRAHNLKDTLRLMKPRIIALSMVPLLSACGAGKTAPAAAAPKPAFGNFGIDTAQMDTSVKPGDDFYKYVNGKWVSTFKMPADKARYGVFDALSDKSESDVTYVAGRTLENVSGRRFGTEKGGRLLQLVDG